MNTRCFLVLYFLLLFPNILLLILSLSERRKRTDVNAVRVTFFLKIVMFLCSVISLLGALANGLDYYYQLNNDIEIVIMLAVVYLLTTFVQIVICKEKIVYSKKDGTIRASKLFSKKNFNVSEITRFYFSAEYLDIYLGEERVRYGNNFLVGVDEFETFIKNRNG